MTLHYIQHVSFETPGSILAWAQSRQVDLSCTCLYGTNASFPEEEPLDGLVVMGGPMGVDDEDRYSWLKSEKEFIEKDYQDAVKIMDAVLEELFA